MAVQSPMPHSVDGYHTDSLERLLGRVAWLGVNKQSLTRVHLNPRYYHIRYEEEYFILCLEGLQGTEMVQ